MPVFNRAGAIISIPEGMQYEVFMSKNVGNINSFRIFHLVKSIRYLVLKVSYDVKLSQFLTSSPRKVYKFNFVILYYANFREDPNWEDYYLGL